jgi:hypothetical protein
MPGYAKCLILRRSPSSGRSHGRSGESVVEFPAAGAGFTMVSLLSSEAEAGSNPGRALQPMGSDLWQLRFRPGPGTCWRAARTGLRNETMGTVSCRHGLRRSTRPGRWRLDGVAAARAHCRARSAIRLGWGLSRSGVADLGYRGRPDERTARATFERVCGSCLPSSC